MTISEICAELERIARIDCDHPRDQYVEIPRRTVLALVAKLREANRLVTLSAAALDMLELDWHLSQLRVDMQDFEKIDVR